MCLNSYAMGHMSVQCEGKPLLNATDREPRLRCRAQFSIHASPKGKSPARCFQFKLDRVAGGEGELLVKNVGGIITSVSNWLDGLPEISGVAVDPHSQTSVHSRGERGVGEAQCSRDLVDTGLRDSDEIGGGTVHTGRIALHQIPGDDVTVRAARDIGAKTNSTGIRTGVAPNKAPLTSVRDVESTVAAINSDLALGEDVPRVHIRTRRSGGGINNRYLETDLGRGTIKPQVAMDLAIDGSFTTN